MSAIRENGATSGPGVLATFGYDQLGRRTSLTRGNGTATTYGYDAVSRLASLVQSLPGTANDLTLGFSYNPASQIATNTRSNDLFSYTGHADQSVADSHDGLNRLTGTGGAAIGYDARRNIALVPASASHTGAAITYTYNSENMLTGGGGIALAWDPLMRLYQASTSRWAYDGAEMIAEYNTSNALLRRFVHGPGVDEPLVWYEGAGTANRRWLHADERGSVVAISDGTGTVTGTNHYNEYGAPASPTAGRFQYTGQVWLASLGMYYYRARFYHPRLGRFMQTDPIGYGSGMNLYAYVGGDPINFADPSGLEVCTGTRIDSDKPCVIEGGGGVSTGLMAGSAGFSGEAAGAFLGLSSGGSGQIIYVPGIPGSVTSTGGNGPNQTITVTAGTPGYFYSAGGFGGFASSGMFHRASQGPQRGDLHFRVRDFAFCSADELFAQFRKAGNSAPGAPYARSGTTPDIILTGGNPITQSVNVGARRITNVTQEGHRYHPGSVVISVTSTWYGSAVSIEGRGTGPRALENSIFGEAIFTALSARATVSCTVGAD